MKWGEIPAEQIIEKLKKVRFSTASENYKNYTWCKEISELAQFVTTERNELIKKYGKETNDGYAVTDENKPVFFQELEKFLNEDMPKASSPFPFDEADFSSDKCCYDTNPNYWLSAQDFEVLFKLKQS